MDVQSIKTDLIHWLTELQDKSVLKKLQGLKEEQEKSSELTLNQNQELENRLEKYEAGEIRFSSWDTVKNRVKKDQANFWREQKNFTQSLHLLKQEHQ